MKELSVTATITSSSWMCSKYKHKKGRKQSPRISVFHGNHAAGAKASQAKKEGEEKRK